ncbi:cytochrome c [Niveibacterium sp. SC-1]|uniref:c-type cytochrome n=1 Tax=Niveibacterium sp. SC-1 TaxID=3135646 RepID=UPI00311E2953
MRIQSFILALGCMTVAGSALAADHPGKAVFDRTCAMCHTPTGAGMPGVFPPLAKSDYFLKATPGHLVHILDKGLQGEVTVNGQKYNNIMPPQSLSDADAAAVINYVSEGLNGGKPLVQPAQVPKLKVAQ